MSNQLQLSIQETFNNNTKHMLKDVFIFRTENASKIKDVFILNLPLELRQIETCNTCFGFFNSYASHVYIDNNYKIKSLFWDEDNVTDPRYIKAIKSVREYVERQKISLINTFKIFDPKKQFGEIRGKNIRLGHKYQNFLNYDKPNLTENENDYSHLFIDINSKNILNKSELQVASILSELNTSYKVLRRSLSEISDQTILYAEQLLDTGSLFRSELIEEQLKWLKQIKQEFNNLSDSKEKENFIYKTVVITSSSFTNVRSNLLGSLLLNIEEHPNNIQAVISKFNAKTDPELYRRTQREASDCQLQEASRELKEKGYINSLNRRFASLEEIPEFVWKNKNLSKVSDDKKEEILDTNAEQESNNPFDFILNKKSKKEEIKNLDLTNTKAVKVMSWKRFTEELLGRLTDLKIKTNNTNNLISLVTSVTPNAKQILKWDNPFSWFYKSGIDTRFKERVEKHGGNYSNNVKIRATLIWKGYTDLDIHAKAPNGEHIYYNRNCRQDNFNKGLLDIDMNGLDQRSEEPVENIFYSEPKSGNYKFYVNHYSGEEVPFELEIAVGSKTFYVTSEDSEEVSSSVSSEPTISFNYNSETEEISNVKTLNGVKISNAGSLNEDWNIPNNDYVQVAGITNSPNLWNNNDKHKLNGEHLIFLINGCENKTKENNFIFFNEMLIPELKKYERALDTLVRNVSIKYLEEGTPQASGLGYSLTNEKWDINLEVTLESGATFKVIIDRYI